MICKTIFCFEFPDIPEKAGRITRRRRRRKTRNTKPIAKRFAFNANAIILYCVLLKAKFQIAKEASHCLSQMENYRTLQSYLLTLDTLPVDHTS